MQLTLDEEICLESAQTPNEWNHVCGLIRWARGGEFPPDWLPKVIASDMPNRLAKRWGKPDIFQKHHPKQSFAEFLYGLLPL